MKRLVSFVITGGMLILASCSTESLYLLEKKYPAEIPSIKIRLLHDSVGLITKKEGDQNAVQKFSFTVRKRNFIIVNDVFSDPAFITLQAGDTIVRYRSRLYLIDKDQKLVFKRSRRR